jgi:O-antigen ligase
MSRVKPSWPRDWRERLPGLGLWALGLLVLWLIYFSPRQLVSPSKALTYLVALGVLLLAVKRPDRSLLTLIVLLPFQGLILSKLFAIGLPVSADKALGSWKELLAIAVVIAGIRGFLASGRSADTIDRVALGFVLLAAVYAAFQAKIVPSAPASSTVRLLGFREMAGFVLLALGARHAQLGPRFARRACRALFAAAVLVAGVGLFEASDSGAWNSFVISTIHYPTYQYEVLGQLPPNQFNIITYGYVGGHRFVRIGSVFLDSLTLSWYLILPFAIGIERILRRRSSPWVMLGTAMIGIALLLTQTRSSILGAIVVVVLALQPAAGRGRHWRTQFALLLVGVALVGLPAAFASGVAQRVARTGSARNQDTAGHLSGFTQGVDTIGSHPLGLGLGTGAGTGQRFQVSGDVIPENNYLEVGDELGIVGLGLFVALTVALLVGLRRAARASPEPLAAAAWAASAGLAVSALFLQTWSDLSVAWTFWALAGFVLALGRQPARVLAPSGAAEISAASGQTTQSAALSSPAGSSGALWGAPR